MASQLPTLAMEVIWLLVDRLKPSDILSLRLVCRELNVKTMPAFCRIYFFTLKTKLSPWDMPKLDKISGFLCSQFQVLHIPDLYHSVHTFGSNGPSPIPHLVPDDLNKILTKCVNCRSFYIDGDDDASRMEMPGSDYFLTPSDILRVIFSFVAETGLEIKSLRMQTGSGYLDTRRLLTPPYDQVKFRSGWAHLEELVLDCNFTPNQYEWAIGLIVNAPELHKLSLRFPSSMSIIDPILERFVSTKSCSVLQDFTLIDGNVSGDLICDFLRLNAATLRTLSFESVTAVGSGGWRTIMTSMISSLQNLETCSVGGPGQDTGERNESLSLSKFLEGEHVPGTDRMLGPHIVSNSRKMIGLQCPVHLSYYFENGPLRVYSVTYTGCDMNKFLRTLTEAF